MALQINVQIKLITNKIYSSAQYQFTQMANDSLQLQYYW